ncbi:hypothetical protein Dimus_006009 [Dionaea muscipula]
MRYGLDRGILTLQNHYDRLSRWSIDNEKWVTRTGRARVVDQEAALHDYRVQLDRMTADVITWTPFGSTPDKAIPITLFNGIIHCRSITEPYMPDRVLGLSRMRQLWDAWHNHLIKPIAMGSRRACYATEVDDDYMEWNVRGAGDDHRRQSSLLIAGKRGRPRKGVGRGQGLVVGKAGDAMLALNSNVSLGQLDALGSTQRTGVDLVEDKGLDTGSDVISVLEN